MRIVSPRTFLAYLSSKTDRDAQLHLGKNLSRHHYFITEVILTYDTNCQNVILRRIMLELIIKLTDLNDKMMLPKQAMNELNEYANAMINSNNPMRALSSFCWYHIGRYIYFKYLQFFYSHIIKKSCLSSTWKKIKWLLCMSFDKEQVFNYEEKSTAWNNFVLNVCQLTLILIIKLDNMQMSFDFMTFKRMSIAIVSKTKTSIS